MSFEAASESEECRNLYVNNLPEMTDIELKNLFAPFGPIERVRVSTHPGTGVFAGYGFVLFERGADGQKAIAAMNDYVIGGKKLAVRLKTAKVKPQQPINANLYVQGLPLSYTKKELDDLFGPYGQVAESRVMIDYKTQQSKGIAFVRYAAVEAANSAIAALNGKIPPNGINQITVKFALDKSSSVQSVIGGLLAAYGPQRGLGNNARFNPMSAGRGRGGLGGNMPGYNMGLGQPLINAYPQGGMGAPGLMQYGGLGQEGLPAPNSPHGFSLFVFHLPNSVTENDLHQLFSLYGPVTHVNIIREPTTGASKGYGFVNMLNYRDAENAVQFLNGFALGNKFLKVSFKKDKQGL